MNAHDTPSGTRMMWNIKVNAICALAHGTGSTAARTAVPPNVAITSTTAFLQILLRIVDGDSRSTRHPRRVKRRGSGEFADQLGIHARACRLFCPRRLRQR